MHVPINVKSPNNISEWQMGFNSAFKGLIKLHSILSYTFLSQLSNSLFYMRLFVGFFILSGLFYDSILQCGTRFFFCILTSQKLSEHLFYLTKK